MSEPNYNCTSKRKAIDWINKYGKSTAKLNEVVYYSAYSDILAPERKHDLERISYDWILIVPKYSKIKEIVIWNLHFWIFYIICLTLVSISGFSYKQIGIVPTLIFALLVIMINLHLAHNAVKRFKQSYYEEFK